MSVSLFMDFSLRNAVPGFSGDGENAEESPVEGEMAARAKTFHEAGEFPSARGEQALHRLRGGRLTIRGRRYIAGRIARRRPPAEVFWRPVAAAWSSTAPARSAAFAEITRTTFSGTAALAVRPKAGTSTAALETSAAVPVASAIGPESTP
jgi:hypothetical protein